MSQRALQRRPEQHARDTDDDESATDREIDRDVLYARGRTKCGQVERRRLIEEVGCEDAVTFVGEAAAAGRQAEQLEDENASDQEDSDDTN
jgi:hypothetical protein